MPAVLGRLENYGPVEQRNHPGNLIVVGMRIAVKFEHAAPVSLPVGVEVDDQVQSAVGVRYRMAIEIDMRFQGLAVAIVVRAPAEVVRVVEQVRDAGYPGKLCQEFLALDNVIQSGISTAERANSFAYGLVSHLSILVDGMGRIEFRKFRAQARRDSCLQEVIDHDVAEWVPPLELFCGGRQPCQHLFGNHRCATVITCP